MEKTVRPRPRRRWLFWTIVIIVGVALGLGSTKLLKLMKITNTGFGDLINPPFGGQEYVRILVIGEDNTSKLRKNGRGLSDTIIVAGIDLKNKTVHTISIPRDSRVEIPGHGTQKINASNALEGPELTRDIVQRLTGVSIDYYVKTDLMGLTNIVDMVGGVGLDVEKDLRYTDRAGGLYINLRKGYRWLNGKKAMGYVRFRHDALGDISRMERQQKFLRALSRQMVAPKNWSRLGDITETMYKEKYIETNLNMRDLKALAELARDVPQDKVKSEIAPGAPERIGAISYMILDEAQLMRRAQQFLQPGGVVATANIEVLNGTRTGGLAKEVADILTRAGYSIVNVGNAPSSDYEKTRLIVHRKTDAEVDIAKLLYATDVKFEDSSSTEADITIIVGNDYRQR